jgi:hypothetical protein
LTLSFLAGCADDRFARAAVTTANDGQVGAALSVADEERRIGRTLPAYPTGCRSIHRSGVATGDRLDLALVKTDRALARANGQIRECAGWYEEIKTRLEEARPE